MEELIKAYNQTLFKVNGFQKPITVGCNSIEADNFLQKTTIKSWAYITAFNPLSVIFSDADNKNRNSLLKESIWEYVYEEGTGVDVEEKWPGEKSFFVAGITKEKAISLAWKFGQRAIVFGHLKKPAELLITIHSEGNNEIIRHQKTAFLCSRKVSANVVLKCYDWAIEQRETGKCVISGFHSQLEKDVLHYLLKGEQPIIVVLARGLKQGIEPELQEAFDKGRLLFITPFGQNMKRVTEKTASLRNEMMMEIADDVVVGFAREGGKLKELISHNTKPLKRLTD